MKKNIGATLALYPVPLIVVGAMKDGDSVILYNFRGDRALEISMAFDGGADSQVEFRGRRAALNVPNPTLWSPASARAAARLFQ